MKRPTIYDLERVTGFSVGTISRAFNARPRIDPKTRELILAKAKEIGYVPHAGARAMTQGKTGRWGLLLPHLENARYAEFMTCLDLEARKRKSLMMLGLSHYDANIEADLVMRWASGEVDGIVTDSWLGSYVFERLYERRFPMVFLFGRPSPKFHVIGIDLLDCAITLMNRLVDEGHKRIAYVGSDVHPLKAVTSAFTAYDEVMKARGLAGNEELIFYGTNDNSAGEEAWDYWRKSPNRPTAFFCFNDVIACGLIRAAREDGCSVPEQLSVVGSDDAPLATAYNLTTIRSEPSELAQQAFALLETPYSGEGMDVNVGSRIVERGSIGKPPAQPAAKKRPKAEGRRPK